jgi:hypothetical protein
MAVALSVLALIAVFFLNTFGFTTVVARAEESAAHQAGLAALQQVDPTVGLARWEIDPAKATTVARDYAAYNLAGMTEGSPRSPGSYNGFIDYASIPGGDLSALLHDTNGTVGDSVYGLDVEVLVPAQVSGQTSEHFLNCDPLATCTSAPPDPKPSCDNTDQNVFPQQVGSVLTGLCYTHSAIILRLRLPAFQLGTGAAAIDRVIVTQAGTDA